MERDIESGAAPDAQADIAALEKGVCDAIAREGDVRGVVRDLTVQALSTQNRDLESLRRIMTAVMRGVHEGARQKLPPSPASAQAALAPVRDAVAGLDAGLAQFAEASKLALEEARGRAQAFSSEELARLRTELEGVEALFFEIVQTSAATAHEAVSETLRDLVAHARRSGTSVGAQLKDTLAAFNREIAAAGQSRVEAGLQLTQAVTGLMRQIAAGVLTGIAERIRSDGGSEKPG
ncbi:DUF6781 family protein [Nitrosovibrio sp. Nv17]|jgi:hypothetical protein|uniref:DUF6781 family protein n=1 Tax=Nitrosovibrio sp. Nv17 TaxID=1855339 RepID=UPI00090850A5|nr:DUF6781 family protein [Nitrosovibrio sp. Nv17]SFW40234.1 hypothetical protein SAMN05216414_1383 [Nitrosovibrio sp. Nv17]